MNGSRLTGGQSPSGPPSALADGPANVQAEQAGASIAKPARPTPTLYSFDLNVLVTLRELIRERNVTRAAERLGVTQPAVSATLSRLRKYFGDELLVRDRGGYRLTPLAASIAEQVDALCAGAERLLAFDREFDPATSEREFTCLMADYSAAMLGEALSQLMQKEAGRAALHVRMVRESLTTEYVDVIRFIDGMVAPASPFFKTANMRSVELFSDRWVCVTSPDNPAIARGSLSLADLAGLPWVAPYYQQGYAGVPISGQLRMLGIQPRIAVRVESYLAVPYFVPGTDRVALVQERLARQAADRIALTVLECPAPLEPITESLWWHERYEDDQAHRFFRELVQQAARGIGKAPDEVSTRQHKHH